MKKQPLKYRFNVLGMAVILFLSAKTYLPLFFKSLRWHETINIWLVCCMISLVVSCLVPIKVIRTMGEIKPKLYTKLPMPCLAAIIAYGIFLITAANVVNQSVLYLLSKLGVEFGAHPLLPAKTFTNWLLYFIFIAIIPALFEELFLRGYVLSLFRQDGNAFAVLFSAAVFTVMHNQVQSYLSVFFAGVLLGCIYVATGSLLPCIALHFANNAISFFGLYTTESGNLSLLSMAVFMNLLIFALGIWGRSYLKKNRIRIFSPLQNTKQEMKSMALFFKSPVAILSFFICLGSIAEQLYLEFIK